MTKDLDNADRYAQLVNFEDNYYYFTDLNQQESAMLTEMSDNGIEAVVIDESTIEIHGLKGIRLSSEELSVLRKKDFEGVRNVAILYAGILLLNLICTFIQTWVLQLSGQNIMYTIRQELFEHVHSLPLRYFDTHPVGRIVTRITNDVESLHEMYANILVRLFKNSVKIIGLAVVMLMFNIRLSLYAFVMVPIIAVLTVVFKTISRRVHRLIRTRISLLNTFLSENI